MGSPGGANGTAGGGALGDPRNGGAVLGNLGRGHTGEGLAGAPRGGRRPTAAHHPGSRSAISDPSRPARGDEARNARGASRDVPKRFSLFGIAVGFGRPGPRRRAPSGPWCDSFRLGTCGPAPSGTPCLGTSGACEFAGMCDRASMACHVVIRRSPLGGGPPTRQRAVLLGMSRFLQGRRATSLFIATSAFRSLSGSPWRPDAHVVALSSSVHGHPGSASEARTSAAIPRRTSGPARSSGKGARTATRTPVSGCGNAKNEACSASR